MGEATDQLLGLLELDDQGDDTWVAPTPEGGPPRLFGGQVAAQSLRAATHTISADRPAHSLHAYFIRPGAPGVPLELQVERVRDGRSFATRRVTAAQQGEAIFVLDASFHRVEPGDDWQLPPPTTGGPDEAAGTSPFGGWGSINPFEMRPVRSGGGFLDVHPFWIRTKDPLPDDPALHTCLLTFISDMAVVLGARAPDSTSPPFAGASLDHSLWFHRPARVDEWLLFGVEPISNSGARGLAFGAFHDADGRRVVSVAQEALLRPASAPSVP